MKFNTAYSKKVRVTAPIQIGAGRTKQSFAKECDINNIMAKFQKTGAVTHTNRHAPSYGFADSVTFDQAMNVIAQANTMFADLPSSLRDKFNGNPGEYLDFVSDPANKAEMVTLGLALAETEVPAKEPVKAPEAKTEETEESSETS